MGEFLQFIKDVAPGAAFYIALAVGVGWYLKQITGQAIKSLTTITNEIKGSYKVIIQESNESKEELKKEIQYYTNQLNGLRAENNELRTEVIHLKKSYQAIELQITEVQQILGDGFSLFAQGIEAIDERTRALFSDRDKLSQDLSLAWKVILKNFGVSHTLNSMSNSDELPQVPKIQEANL